MLTLTDAEVKTFDTELEPVLEWAKTRSAEAEQLALDCARLLSCTEDRLDQIKGQSFFQRCWGRLSGKTGEMERANTSDLIQMQKASLRYLGLLQERQLMMAHAMLTLKNNLVALAVKEEETRLLILDLANNTLKRFQELENRVDQLEISTNLQGWVLTLEERGYEEKFKTKFFRMFRVINDFYNYKSDEWNYTDILFLRKALKLVGINPKIEISIQEFVEESVEEIISQGFNIYEELVLSQFVDRQMGGERTIKGISSNYFTAIHALLFHYIDKSEIVEILGEELSVSKDVALKKIILRTISRLNVDVSKTMPLSDIAIEILGGIRLANIILRTDIGNDLNSDLRQNDSFSQCEKVSFVNADDLDAKICSAILARLKDCINNLKKMHLKYLGDFSSPIDLNAIKFELADLNPSEILASFDPAAFNRSSTESYGQVVLITRKLIVFETSFTETRYRGSPSGVSGIGKHMVPIEISKVIDVSVLKNNTPNLLCFLLDRGAVVESLTIKLNKSVTRIESLVKDVMELNGGYQGIHLCRINS